MDYDDVSDYDRDGDETDVGDPHCEDCHAPCVVKVVDFGIGSYECHGAKGYDRNLQAVSDCCEAGIYDLDSVAPIVVWGTGPIPAALAKGDQSNPAELCETLEDATACVKAGGWITLVQVRPDHAKGLPGVLGTFVP